MKRVERFKKGQRWDKSPTRENLNRLVDQGNTSAKLRGDAFIGVNRTEGVGTSVFLHLQQLLARIPHPGPKLVKVYQSGGAAGDYNTTCTWTYEVRDPDGVTVLGDTDTTPVAPQKARIPTCIYTKAPDDSYGLAVWDGETFILLEAYGEYPTLAEATVVEDVNYSAVSHKLEYDWRKSRVLAADTLDNDGDADNLVTTSVACP